MAEGPAAVRPAPVRGPRTLLFRRWLSGSWNGWVSCPARRRIPTTLGAREGWLEGKRTAPSRRIFKVSLRRRRRCGFRMNRGTPGQEAGPETEAQRQRPPGSPGARPRAQGLRQLWKAGLEDFRPRRPRPFFSRLGERKVEKARGCSPTSSAPRPGLFHFSGTD